MMMTFADFYNKYELNERALNIGNRSVSYPKYNNVLILAGGAGSGKSTILNDVITFRGKLFNVDEIKHALIKLDDHSALRRKFEQETGLRLDMSSLKDPVELSALHAFVKRHKLNDKLTSTFFTAAASRQYKDNVIFDVTLKDTDKLDQITDLCDIGGYHPINRHIVWVCTNVDLALKRNANRERTIANDIVLETHKGVSTTLKKLIQHRDQTKIDGDVWIVFNGVSINGEYDVKFDDRGVNKYTAFQIKQKGKPFKTFEQISTAIIDKINKYVPDDVQW